MNWKFRIILVLVVVGFIAFMLKTPMQTDSIAKSTDEGRVVAGSNGKIFQHDNNIYRVEADNFAISEPVSEMATSDYLAFIKNRFADRSKPRKAQNEDEFSDKDRAERGLAPLTDDEKADMEKNPRNKKRVKNILPDWATNEVDPLIGKGTDSLSPQAMPAPSLTFDGATSADNVALGQGSFTPPDVNGDVGPNHYFSSINVVAKIFNKSGTVVAGPFKTSDIWANLPTGDPCRTRNDGDPVVVYDSLADRWVITQFAIPGLISGSGNNYECVAVSTTADPTGTYYTWSYQYPGGIGNDYPKIAVWTDAYHMTFNQFNNAGTAFLGMGILSQDRVKALAGDPTASVVYTNIATIDPNAGGGLPADIDGIVPPPAGMAEVIGEFRATEFGDPLDAIRYYKWVPNFVTPASSTISVLPDVALAAFDATSPSSRAVMEVPSPGVALDGLNDRLMHRLAYRNLGTFDAPVNSFTGNFTVNVSGAAGTTAATYQGGIRWWEMRRSGDTFSVFDQGTHNLTPGNGSTGLNNWMGSIAQDYQGNIGLGFSQSGSAQNAHIKIAGRTNNVANSGTLNEGEAMMFAAGGVQTSTGNRWGDYSAMNIDPTDDCTFWYTQEYYAATSSVNWSTRVGKFKYPTCVAGPRATITGTITSCDSGLPISAATVAATGGFNRITIVDGTYTMSVAPGTYTVSASKSGGFTGASQTTTVANGATNVVNICLSGVPVIAPGAASITAESCGVANGVPDPGELLTVSLPITNTGASNTVNLTATLAATGGVINPPAPVSYGVVAAGGAAVTRPFTFTVNPAALCGSTITLTWTLQDGATSHGTVTKTYTLGTGGVSLVNFTNSAAITLNDGTSTAAPGPASPYPSAVTVSGLTGTARLKGITLNGYTHTFPSDNDMVIVSPAGQAFAFNSDNGGGGDISGINITFDDDSTVVPSTTQLTSGTFRPTNATAGDIFPAPGPGSTYSSPPSVGTATMLATFGTSASALNGTWNVYMTDDASVDTGTISGGVTLIFETQNPFVCNTCAAANTHPRADYDNDGKTDLSVYRPSEGNWYLNRSTAGFTVVNFGISTDVIAPADYDGDNKHDEAVFRANVVEGAPDFYVLNSATNTITGAAWGTAGDVPVVSDYDADNKDDFAVWRSSTGDFWVLQSTDGALRHYHFGAAGDKPVAGDYTGDAKADFAVFRPSTGTWYIADNVTNAVTATSWGISTDIPVFADYDGDSKEDIAVFRPSDGTWYILKSSGGAMYVPFGTSGDVPVPGDYDGDGKYEPAVYRGGTWYVNQSTSGLLIQQFGLATDQPTPRWYIPQ